MPPRYVIHVGPMKTASTYVQQCFTAVQPELEAKGVFYPPELIDPGNRHMHMPVYQAMVRGQAESLRPIFARINEAGHKTVVISCEHLIFLRPAEFETLRDVIGVPDIEIVYALRRWSDRISSLWSQGLFMGSPQTLPEFYLGLLNGRTPEYYRKQLGDKVGVYDIDYSLAWREHVSVFGRDALRLFAYSTAMDDDEDVFTRFCTDIVGLSDVPKPQFLGEKRWASLARDDSEILRALNAMYVKEEGKSTVAFREMMMRKRKQIDRSIFVNAMAGETAELAIDDNAVDFDAAYARMMEFADRVAGSNPSGEIFARVSRQNKYVRQGWLVEPGVAEALRALYGDWKAAFQKAA